MLSDKVAQNPITVVESSKGNFGISYEMMFSRIVAILKSNNPILINHAKAGRLLHIVHDIIIKDNKFSQIALGGLELLITDDKLDPDKKYLVYDIAQLDNRSIMFIFKNNIINDYINDKDVFANLYQLYDVLVSMTVLPELCSSYYTIYSAIARYAPYVLTIKTMLALGYSVKYDVIDFDVIPGDNINFVTEETLDIVKSADAEDLLSYGILCDYANKR